ncbi:MAG: PEGA domain-containing protein, partial [Deltaproteobacteria bacterium]|nr:PEGA domain-containing protein [Deltaproteobacteria bacterium]
MPKTYDGPNPKGWGHFIILTRKGIAILLCAVLPAQWAAPAGFVQAQPRPEPALLLKYAAPDIPEPVSRATLDSLPGLVAKEVRVRWVSAPAESAPGPERDTAFPVPDDAALRRISGNISRASMHMERVENEEAWKLLAEAEKEARGCRFTETTRPFLAEIFLRGGILKLREGDVPSGEALFARSRALRPGFSPDPALFPPQVLAAWENACRRPIPEAELLVQSLPSGAGIAVDGEYKGKTPSRVRPGKTAPVRIRVFHGGYRDAEVVGQWLPGDSATLDFGLSGDRVARLGELLADGDGKRGRGAGPLIAEFAAAAGVERVAVVVLEKDPSGEGFRARAYARGIPGGDPVFLGEKDLPAGNRGSETAGNWVAARLLENGWPPETKDPEAKPWYKKWWPWGILLSAAGLAALLAG